jgi:hypothetical protein
MSANEVLAPVKVLSNDERAVIIREAERNWPDLWRRCYPRSYREYKPGEYDSAKTVSYCMLNAAKKIEYGVKRYQKLGSGDVHEVMWASQMAQWRTPIYWVTKEFAEAVRLTVPPFELDWHSMAVPFPAAAFMLPRGVMCHRTEGDIRFIAYSRHCKAETVRTLAGTGPISWTSSNGQFLMYASSEDNAFTHWNLPYNDFPTINLAALDAALYQYEMIEHKSIVFPQAAMSEADTQLGIEVAHMLFGLLLLMERQKTLVKMGACLSKIPSKRKGEIPREFWSPSVVGEGFMMRRVGCSLGGTHASPRFHPVRGHYKDIRYGPNLSLVKPGEWIRPYWRGLEDEDI